jgi:hypothetical protein
MIKLSQSVRGAVLCLGLVCVAGACGSDPEPASNNVAGAPVYTGGVAAPVTGGVVAPVTGGVAAPVTGGVAAPVTGGVAAPVTGGVSGGAGGTGGMMAGGACQTAVDGFLMGMSGAGCSACICAKDPMANTKCDAACWALIGCIANSCAGVSTDIACILKPVAMMGCSELVAPGMAMATTFGPTAMMCKTECMK